MMQVTVDRFNANEKMQKVWRKIAELANANQSIVVSLRQETRTHEQNKKMWPMLRDISQHCQWFGKQYGPEQSRPDFCAHE